MLLSPIRLVLFVVGGITTTALTLVGVVVVLTFVGGPDLSAACGGRIVSAAPELAAAFDQKWDAFSDQLDSGGAATVTFSENEITARAVAFLQDESIDEIRNITLCIFSGVNEGEGEIRGTVDLPVLPDVDARLRGVMDLTGPSPRIEITNIDIGSLPGFLTGPLEDAVAAAVNAGLRETGLSRRYAVTYETGAVTIRARP